MTEKRLVSGTREGKSEKEDRRIEKIKQKRREKGKALKVRMGEDTEAETTQHPPYFLYFPWASSCST